MSVTSDLSAAICPLMKPCTVAHNTHTHTFFLHPSKSHAQQQQQTNIYTCTLSMKAAETRDKTQAKITNVTILPFLFIAIFSVCGGLWVVSLQRVASSCLCKGDIYAPYIPIKYNLSCFASAFNTGKHIHSNILITQV